ncbi:hypothetical protein BHE74_00031466, partial [Ensete ventricosum]
PFNRADWQSSCAILSSKAAAVHGSSSDKPPSPSGGPPAADTGARTSLDPVSDLPRALTISDLSPAPMHGSRLRVAYQGVPGAYSESAAGKAYPNCEAIPCDQFEVAFQAVELWIADRAVLPIENSLGGSIHRNYDLLLRRRLHIVGEVQLPVHHCLLALPGVRKEYLTRAFDDTAGAAEHVASKGLRDTAAIASARAAELYGLQVLADGIQDDGSNVTRFSISVLFKVLSAFAFRNICLTKIESRPHRLVDDANVGTAKHFEYMFYIDFQASMAETRAQNALAEIQEFTSFLRLLGSYPMGPHFLLHLASASSSSVD